MLRRGIFGGVVCIPLALVLGLFVSRGALADGRGDDDDGRGCVHPGRSKVSVGVTSDHEQYCASCGETAHFSIELDPKEPLEGLCVVGYFYDRAKAEDDDDDEMDDWDAEDIEEICRRMPGRSWEKVELTPVSEDRFSYVRTDLSRGVKILLVLVFAEDQALVQKMQKRKECLEKKQQKLLELRERVKIPWLRKPLDRLIAEVEEEIERCESRIQNPLRCVGRGWKAVLVRRIGRPGRLVRIESIADVPDPCSMLVAPGGENTFTSIYKVKRAVLMGRGKKVYIRQYIEIMDSAGDSVRKLKLVEEIPRPERPGGRRKPRWIDACSPSRNLCLKI